MSTNYYYSMLSILPIDDTFRSAFEGFYRDMSSLAKIDPSGTAQYEQDDKIVFEFNMLGYGKKDIEVKLLKDERKLVVKGQRPSYPNRKYLYNCLAPKERSYSMALLDKSLDLSSAAVSFDSGVLKVEFTKLSEIKQSELSLVIE